MYIEKSVSVRKPSRFTRHIAETQFYGNKPIVSNFIEIEIYLNMFEKTRIQLTPEQCYALIYFDLYTLKYGNTIALYASRYDYDEDIPLIELPEYAYKHLKRIVKYFAHKCGLVA